MTPTALDTNRPSSARLEPPWKEFAGAPLVPIAIAASFGLILDRFAGFPFEFGLGATVAGLGAWIGFPQRQKDLGMRFLMLAFLGLAAMHHHAHRSLYRNDDIGNLAEELPQIARIRGIICETPNIRKADRTEIFGPARRVDRAVTLLTVTEVSPTKGHWHPATGQLLVVIDLLPTIASTGLLDHIQAGDHVELIGQLARPPGPANPGEWDYASMLQDQRIRAELRITKANDAVVRLSDEQRLSWPALVPKVRRMLTNTLDRSLSTRESALARALLLGDGTPMDREEWDAFARTGVIHVLAISGQHLVILAGFIWILFRILGVPRRIGCWVVIVLIVAYAILTGLRPSATRAAVMVVAICGNFLIRRPPRMANNFALAWLVVILMNPTDPFSAGCQLSFVSVFVLCWGVQRWLQSTPDPLDRLIQESRPLWLQIGHHAFRLILMSYFITFVLTLVNAPLVVHRQNLLTPSGILLGPPLILLTAIALLFGFALLLLGQLLPLSARVLSPMIEWSLRGCDSLVHWVDDLPGSSIYVPSVSMIWLIGFYVLLAAMILQGGKASFRLGIAMLAWTIVGLIDWPRGSSDELRATFLAVGHGGCTVLETPDGRTLLYDAGTMAGPDSVRRIIAPYLWQRGIRRIDELFLSHADLDHFNGVVELIRRFPIGRVTLTPSFAFKQTIEVAEVLTAIKRASIPMRTVVASQRFAAGEVNFEVLHPPEEHFPGTENEHSMVLLVTHRRHSLLLTGDLEKTGTQRLPSAPPRHGDVMMAPHHGSRPALSAELLNWASPRMLVVSRSGRIGSPVASNDPRVAGPIWDTWSQGAITIRSNSTGMTAEAFRSGERAIVVRGGR